MIIVFSGRAGRVASWIHRQTRRRRKEEYNAEEVTGVLPDNNFEGWCAMNNVETRKPHESRVCKTCGKGEGKGELLPGEWMLGDAKHAMCSACWEMGR